MKPAKQDLPPPETEVPLWRPSWRWHGIALGAIYVSLLVIFFAMDRFLSRLPEPYKLREVPKEMTPWLSK